jgi:protease I
MKVAILALEGFEQAEMTEPRKALQQAGAETHLVSKEKGQVQAFKHHDRADKFDVDRTLDEVRAGEYDAVLLPGGALNADTIRTNEKAQQFVRDMQAAGKPFFVICHAPWLLVSAGLVKGRKLTSWPTLQDDIRNAGGEWVDQQVVTDGNWVTSRKPDDIPAFNKAMLELLASRQHTAA